MVINNVAEDPVYRGHPTPAMYGFQSYIAIPIVMPDGTLFGTLCAIDPKPRMLTTPEIIGSFKLFAELIAFHLDASITGRRDGGDACARTGALRAPRAVHRGPRP